MEEELELVQIDVFGTDSVFPQIGSHQNAETVLAYNSFIESLRATIVFCFLLISIFFNLFAYLFFVIFDQLFLFSDSLQV